jgi:chromate transporter
VSCKDIFIGFLRSGLLGYGGGPSTIPLVRYEAVDRYHWMDDEEFAEVLAMANALPGPIATKMATYIGYKVKGTMGAIVANLATVMPTVIALIVLLGSLYAMGNSKIVHGMIMAVGPVIGMMLGVMTYQFLQKSWKGLGTIGSIVMVVVSLVALQILKIHPAIMIALFIVYALIKTYVATRQVRQSQNFSTLKRSVEK